MSGRVAVWAEQDAGPVQSLLYWDISCQGWLCALMGQLRLPGWQLPPGVYMWFRWAWEAGEAGFHLSWYMCFGGGGDGLGGVGVASLSQETWVTLHVGKYILGVDLFPSAFTNFTKYRGFIYYINCVCFEDNGYLNKPGMNSLDCRNNLILFCWLFKVTVMHGALMASKM